MNKLSQTIANLQRWAASVCNNDVMQTRLNEILTLLEHTAIADRQPFWRSSMNTMSLAARGLVDSAYSPAVMQILELPEEDEA